MKISSILTIAAIFILVLIPSLHVPHLADDYFYMGIANMHAQLEHYNEWSGRVITNVFSAYMIKYANHSFYMGLNAAAFTTIVVLISSLPYTLLHGKFSVSPVGLIIIFTLMWIANPALAETSFWFVGAANYLWPSMYVALFMVIVSLQKEKLSVWKIPFALAMGFMAGCSNENTSVVLILLTIGYFFHTNKFKISYPYLTGLLVGSAVLLLSPGSAKRSLAFTDWHALSFVGKLDLQLFTRFPDSFMGFWQVYLVIIFMALCHSASGEKNRKPFFYGLFFFISAIMCNAAFLASPYMPERAYSGTLFMLLITTSFIFYAVMDITCKITKWIVITSITTFCFVYLIPSYVFFTHSVIRTWEQEKIRMEMLNEQISNGNRNPVIPNYYLPRLLKKTDGYPNFQNPYMLHHFGVNSIIEKEMGFDYSALNKCSYIKVDQSIFNGITLDSVCLLNDKISGDKKIVYRIIGDINKLFNNGNALYSHVFMQNGQTFNKDTVVQAVFMAGYWYTYSDAINLELDKIKDIKIGIYNSKTMEIYSNIIIKP
ncbi:TPA: hypothetical protein I8271_004084 [Kluyvera intermedia]|uniref:Uncharacterized protein n=2 Tax=Enterobacteriaceae TaxID=543 RepID=A0AAC8QKQ8_9ENTR|nr:DUF6056 family protein [Phytobacter ursingii]HAT2206539.1 hypothetical protein [Kluyvera intermedia]AKL10531.1 hypothetical protein AB182_03940 [Phytobacter ursingii]HAT2517262.1 hypothetical protein [Kluyvera intermedia]HAT2605263.1 hypothetical protein [Kluyvera intermedia]HAT2682110.1 hypothetical protein [Kluyvera intermedia]